MMAGNATEEATFDTQINGEALIAEINLLLDFISGRSDRALGGGLPLRLPAGFKDYGELLARYFDIRTRVVQSQSKSVPEAAAPVPVPVAQAMARMRGDEPDA